VRWSADGSRSEKPRNISGFPLRAPTKWPNPAGYRLPAFLGSSASISGPWKPILSDNPKGGAPVNDKKARAWFLRVATDTLKSPYIMDNASATDWRVLLCIANHQGYQNRKTFPLYIARTAEEARCSRRTAIRSISWWCKVGALIKTKCRRMNVYEIPQHFSVPPGIGASPRHITSRRLNRDDQGRIVPSIGTGKVPAHGTSEVPAYGTPNQKYSSEVFIKNPPSPPTGGNGQSSETSVRPRIQISDETINEFSKTLGKEKTIALLKQGNYPLPPILLEGERS